MTDKKYTSEQEMLLKCFKEASCLNDKDISNKILGVIGLPKYKDNKYVDIVKSISLIGRTKTLSLSQKRVLCIFWGNYLLEKFKNN